jgi:hypothetical protein
MSSYTVYYSSRKDMYKNLAVRWSKWAADSNLTVSERKGVAMFFKSIAVRFGLVNEFREIGVI